VIDRRYMGTLSTPPQQAEEFGLVSGQARERSIPS
jgi:hypothetical protein